MKLENRAASELQPSDLLKRFAPPVLNSGIVSQSLWSFQAEEPLVPRLLKSEVHNNRGVWHYATGCGDIEAEVNVELDEPLSSARVNIALVNSGSVQSPAITQPCSLAATFALGRQQRMLVLHGGTTESMFPPLAYRPREETGWLAAGEIRGISSNKYLPLLALIPDDEAGGGLVVGMEWSGEWHMTWQRTPADGDNLCLKAAVLAGPFTLEPGERLELPTAHVVWFGGDMSSATQAIRGYLYQRVCACYEGSPVLPPISYDHWFGIENRLNDRMMRTQADRAVELGVEFFVVDASWFEGDFPHGVGNWTRIDRVKFPDGLEALADYVRSKGMKFGLWFEPERAHQGTAAVQDHPDYFIQLPESQECLLNLSLPEAQDWLIDLISPMIERYDIRWSRWDYNINPEAYWRRADPTGKIQFAYMKGLYRVLDTLMSRYPRWFVEQCSSGGHRLDIGTMRRGHSFWFSDQTFDPDMCRAMQAGANHFLPGHLCNSSVAVDSGASKSRLDDAAIISRMLGKLAFDGDIAAVDDERTRRMRYWSDWFRRIRHLLHADFYSLSSFPNTDRDPYACQFVSADGQEAVVFAFRHHAKSERLTLQLKGLQAEVTYRVTDAITQTDSSLIGRELAEGWTVHLENVDRAGLWYLQSAEK
ncbi:MAG: alpha-galactosidase [Armatimonadota bacterium]